MLEKLFCWCIIIIGLFGESLDKKNKSSVSRETLLLFFFATPTGIEPVLSGSKPLALPFGYGAIIENCPRLHHQFYLAWISDRLQATCRFGQSSYQFSTGRLGLEPKPMVLETTMLPITLPTHFGLFQKQECFFSASSLHCRQCAYDQPRFCIFILC